MLHLRSTITSLRIKKLIPLRKKHKKNCGEYIWCCFISPTKYKKMFRVKSIVEKELAPVRLVSNAGLTNMSPQIKQ